MRQTGTIHAFNLAKCRRNLGGETSPHHARGELCRLGHFRPDGERIRRQRGGHRRRHDRFADRIPPRLRPAAGGAVAAIRNPDHPRAGKGVRHRRPGAGATGRRRGSRRAGEQTWPRPLPGQAGQSDDGRSGLPGSGRKIQPPAVRIRAPARSACGRKTISGTAPRWRSASRSWKPYPTGFRRPTPSCAPWRSIAARTGPRNTSCCRSRWWSRSRSPPTTCLAPWFEENKATYAAPEYRKIAYITLLPENIADEQAITDEQVKEDYEQNIARFTTPETRTIEQLVFQSKEAAQAALDSIKAGATFDSMVTARGQDPGRHAARNLRQGQGRRPGRGGSGLQAAGQRSQPDRRGRVRAGAAARHRDQAGGGALARRGHARNPQGSGAGGSQPHPARRARQIRRQPRGRRIAARSGRKARSRRGDGGRRSTARRSGRTALSSPTCRSRRSCSKRRSKPKPASRTPPSTSAATVSCSTRSKAQPLPATGRSTR